MLTKTIQCSYTSAAHIDSGHQQRFDKQTHKIVSTRRTLDPIEPKTLEDDICSAYLQKTYVNDSEAAAFSIVPYSDVGGPPRLRIRGAGCIRH